MIQVLYGCMFALVVAMALVLIRLGRGPGNLDRAVALDVITSASVGLIVVVMALTGRIDPLPLLVIFTSIGFIGSTTIARFSQAESITERRILSREEAEQTPEPVLDDEDAPVHPDLDEDTAVVVDDLDALVADEDEVDELETVALEVVEGSELIAAVQQPAAGQAGDPGAGRDEPASTDRADPAAGQPSLADAARPATAEGRSADGDPTGGGQR